MKTSEAKFINVSILRSSDEVYAFIANPENLPRWASGLSGSIQRVGSDWIAESPMGKIRIKFADRNSFGVVDHDVTLSSGMVVYNPMRVLKNNEGSEVVFTLFRQPQMSDEQFAQDAAWIKKDLATLKSILEEKPV